MREAHSHIDTEQLASAAPSHSTSADTHPRTPTGGRENGAEASLGRKGAWGGSEGWGGREYGADGRLGRTGVWGGSEYGADGSTGQKGGWGGREYGAEGSMGRKGVWGARLGTPRHTDLHFDPQATTFLSPPGGIYLISPGGRIWQMFRSLKLKMTTSGPEPDNKLNLSNATHRVSPAGRRPPAAGKLAVGAARRIGGDERGGA